MGHRCGAPCGTKSSPCKNRVRGFVGYCWQHGGLLGWLFNMLPSTSSQRPSPRRQSGSRAAARRHRPPRQRSEPGRRSASQLPGARSAEFLADVLTDGVKYALASRAADYLGAKRALMLRLRYPRWGGSDCRELAETAKTVRALQAKLHEVTGELVSRLLPEDTPRFHRMLVRKIAEKVPLPPDVKLAAIARGLMVLGIFMCVGQNLPLDRCAFCNLWCQAWSPKRSRRALWNCLMRPGGTWLVVGDQDRRLCLDDSVCCPWPQDPQPMSSPSRSTMNRSGVVLRPCPPRALSKRQPRATRVN